MELKQIIHIDMDAFYASVEQRDYPQYKGLPVIVGGDPDQRGVVSTCSYEAREYGIHSAMPSATARKKCPHAIFLRPRFTVYRQVSNEIRQVLYQFSDCVEPLALDEAYIDVTNRTRSSGSAMLIAKDMRRMIYLQTGLTASAGVSYNKFLAKIASGQCKPNGQLLISSKEGSEFCARLAIKEFYGIGQATAAKMNALGIYTGADLRNWSLNELESFFGKAAHYFYWACRGIDHRSVEPHRERKSISTEDTFVQDITDRNQMMQILLQQVEQVWHDLKRLGMQGRTVTVKVKFNNFVSITRSRTLESIFLSSKDIAAQLETLLDSALNDNRPVRLLGVGVSSLEPHSAIALDQMSLL